MNSQVIGRRLKKLRGDRDQSDVATATGISVSALSMYETGQRIPRDGVKIRLAKYYGVSVEELFYENTA